MCVCMQSISVCHVCVIYVVECAAVCMYVCACVSAYVCMNVCMQCVFLCVMCVVEYVCSRVKVCVCILFKGHFWTSI